MLGWYPHLEMNPHFELSNYRALGAAMTTDGFVVDRWYADFTGDGLDTGPGVTGTDSSLQSEDGDFRSRATIDVTVDTASGYVQGTDNLLIRQRVPYTDRMERRTHHLRVWALGPEGGSFEIALNGSGIQRKSATLVTRGAANVEMAEVGPLFIRDISTSYMTLELFTNPAQLSALYQIVAVQHEALQDGQVYGSPLVYSPQVIERKRCAPFVWVPGNPPATTRSATTVAAKVDLADPMNGNPTVVQTSTTPVWKRLSNSGLTTASGATHTGSLNNRGGLVIVNGFSGLPASPVEDGQLSTPGFLLEAEL